MTSSGTWGDGGLADGTASLQEEEEAGGTSPSVCLEECYEGCLEGTAKAGLGLLVVLGVWVGVPLILLFVTLGAILTMEPRTLAALASLTAVVCWGLESYADTSDIGSSEGLCLPTTVAMAASVVGSVAVGAVSSVPSLYLPVSLLVALAFSLAAAVAVATDTACDAGALGAEAYFSALACLAWVGFLVASHCWRPASRDGLLAAERELYDTMIDGQIELCYETVEGLHTVSCGDPGDPVMLLLHGYGSGAGNWSGNMHALADGGFRVYAMDWRGTGAGLLCNYHVITM